VAVLPVPTELEPEEWTALPFQFDPFDQLAGANLRGVSDSCRRRDGWLAAGVMTSAC
jgi:hypothetical protein